MTQRPRLKLIAPKQIRLLKPVEHYLTSFAKGDVITVEEHDADLLIEGKKAEATKASEKLESVNRFETDEPKEAKSAKVEDKADPAPAVKDFSGAAPAPASSTTQTK